MRRRYLIYALVLLTANAAASACDLPPLVAIPADGRLGEQSAQLFVAVQRYVTGIRAYTACVQAELAAAGGESAPESLRNQLTARNNGAVAEARAVLASFGERVAPAETLYLAEFIAGDGVECIPTSRLESTAVLNDVAVLFVERGGQTYLNVLESQCANLERSGRFEVVRKKLVPSVGEGMGLAQTNRLCADEFIQSYKFDPSAVRDRECPLGRFFELTNEQAERLLGSRDAAPTVAVDGVRGQREETPAPPRTER